VHLGGHAHQEELQADHDAEERGVEEWIGGWVEVVETFHGDGGDGEGDCTPSPQGREAAEDRMA